MVAEDARAVVRHQAGSSVSGWASLHHNCRDLSQQLFRLSVRSVALAFYKPLVSSRATRNQPSSLEQATCEEPTLGPRFGQ